MKLPGRGTEDPPSEGRRSADRLFELGRDRHGVSGGACDGEARVVARERAHHERMLEPVEGAAERLEQLLLRPDAAAGDDAGDEALPFALLEVLRLALHTDA